MYVGRKLRKKKKTYDKVNKVNIYTYSLSPDLPFWAENDEDLIFLFF